MSFASFADDVNITTTDSYDSSQTLDDPINGTLDALATAFQNLAEHNSSLGLDHDDHDQGLSHHGLGATRDSLKIVIPVTVIYSLIFLTGVVGNISTCIVIKKNRSMHTATNYYLFSLAISDFLLLLSGVPQEMYFIWSKYPYVFGEVFCVGRGLVAETSANATVLTITAFTVERYVAICHPFMGQAMSKLSRALRLIVLIWILSVLTAVPQAAQFGIIVYEGVEKCAVVRNIIRHSFQLSTFIFFLAPMSIILVLYLLIGLRLYRSNMIGQGGRDQSGRDQGGRDQGDRDGGGGSVKAKGGGRSDAILYRYTGGTQLSSVQGRMNHCGTRRVLKMLVAVVIGFFLCWAPFHAQRLIAVYGSGAGDDASGADQSHHEVIYTVTTYVSGVLYYLSTCINPLLYNIMSNKFREAFKTILFGKKSKGSTSDSRRQQESRRLRRNPTLTSTTQRDTSESELQSKPSILQAVLNERKVTSQLLP